MKSTSGTLIQTTRSPAITKKVSGLENQLKFSIPAKPSLPRTQSTTPDRASKIRWKTCSEDSTGNAQASSITDCTRTETGRESLVSNTAPPTPISMVSAAHTRQNNSERARTSQKAESVSTVTKLPNQMNSGSAPNCWASENSWNAMMHWRTRG